jgi:malate synthase
VYVAPENDKHTLVLPTINPRAVREDVAWRCAPPAPGMVDRRVEITVSSSRGVTDTRAREAHACRHRCSAHACNLQVHTAGSTALEELLLTRGGLVLPLVLSSATTSHLGVGTAWFPEHTASEAVQRSQHPHQTHVPATTTPPAVLCCAAQGPVDRKMVINALNSGASTFMADFEGR